MTHAEWAQHLSTHHPSDYQEALRLLAQPSFQGVTVYRNNETGVWQWSISIPKTQFWLWSFPTRQEAEALCRDAGWNILSSEEAL